MATQPVITNPPHSELLGLIQQFAVTIFLGILKQAIHNPAHAAGLKSTLLIVRDDINALYPGE